MLRYIYIYSFIILSFVCKTQNLIVNGSFELNSNIDCSTGSYSLTNWINLASPDYFKTECIGNYNVPTNIFGISSALKGNSYIGIIAYHKYAEYKEYIQQYLSTPLISNHSYYLSFYVSRADGMVFSIKNIGCLISVSQPTILSQPYIAANPQIQNQITFITDTISWTKIEGYFTAQGGEQYITIGNFNSNSNTDTLRSGSINPTSFEPPQAYYYIDSVSLYDSLDYVTNIKNHENNFKVNVYPNPNNGNFNIEYHTTKATELIITDITGRLINRYTLLPLQNNLLIKEEELNSGVYFYHILVGEKNLKTDKIVIIK
jgi:OOP family OmpA-OmpF porin